MADNTELFALALPDIKVEEGLRLTAYPDPVSHGAPWTIGYGCTAGVKEGDTWTLEQAEAALEQAATQAATGLDSAIPWWRGLSLPQQAALLDMAFNLGVRGLLGFKTFLAFLRQGQFAHAALDLQGTAWAKEVGERAARIVAQVRTGVHQP